MKTLSFETSKRLDKLWLLKDIETDFHWWFQSHWAWEEQVWDLYFSIGWLNEAIVYKTLTLEEAIEFIWKNMCEVRLLYPNGWQWLLQLQFWQEFKSDSVMWCYEQFLVYLLDNNLLTK